MRPSFLDSMSYEMAEVYGAVTDRILINLAHHFQYLKPGAKIPGSFEYQSRMLAQMGQVNRETVGIIAKSLGGADDALRNVLSAAIMDALKNEEPALRKAAQKGLLNGGGLLPAEVTPNQLQAFQSYYRQSADKLNLVNTVMLESTQNAYTATVSDIVQRVRNTQGILNAGAGEVVTGVSTWNQAMHNAVQKMVGNGLAGFIDHGGHRWSPEAYVAMDIRTTMFNTARSAVWERAESYGADFYQVSSHNGARPLCYPWQGKVISRSGFSGMTEDLDGNKIRVYPESETTKGMPAGLFGINCKHYPMTFIPGFSTLKGESQDEEENEKTYAESQEQRALERKLREEKRDLEVMKAQGASAEAIKAQRDKVHKASADIDEFCDKTGRARRRNREYAPIDAKFPPKDSYNPGEFPTEQRDKMRDWFKNGGDNPPPSPTNIHLGDDNIPPRGQAQIPIQKAESTKRAFTPASTVQEAEEYAKRFLESQKYGSVSYSGIDVEYANKCNDVFTQVFDRFDPKYKLGKVAPMNGREKKFKSAIESSEACYQWGGDGSMFINPRFYKNKKAFAAHKQQIDDLMKTVLDNGQALIDSGKVTGAKKDYVETLLRTKRQCVCQSYDFAEGTIVHECGHMLDDKMFRTIMNETKSPLAERGGLSASLAKYGKNISGYAVATTNEYIAESFTAWWYGETSILDPELVKIFEGAQKYGR